MKYFKYLLPLLLYLYGCGEEALHNPSEKLTTTPVMDIFMRQEEYVNLLSNKKINYRVSCRIFFDGVEYKGLIKASGAGSRSHPKWSYAVTLDNGTILGTKSFILSSQYFDRTSIRSSLVLHIYNLAGYDSFHSNHIFLRINYQDIGLYPLLEKVDEDYFERRSLPVFELYKAGFESKFTFAGSYYPEFHFDKEIPDNDIYSSLYELIKCVDTCAPENVFTGLGKYIDIGDYLRYHAITCITNNPDALENNFFLYRKTINDPFQILPWDFDRSFNLDQPLPLAKESDMLKKLFQNDSARKYYVSYCHYIIDNIFREDILFPVIDSTAASIREAHALDPFLGGFYTIDEETRKLKEFITIRRNLYCKEIDSLLQE